MGDIDGHDTGDTGTDRAEDAALTASVDGELELDDDALEAAAGGQSTNSTLIVFASTFVPFDSSF